MGVRGWRVVEMVGGMSGGLVVEVVLGLRRGAWVGFVVVVVGLSWSLDTDRSLLAALPHCGVCSRGRISGKCGQSKVEESLTRT